MLLEIVKSDVEKRIGEMLDRANGRRRTRTLDLAAVRATARIARENDWAWKDGGTVPGAYNYPASTTLVIAKQCGNDNMSLAVGIVRAPALCSSPGRAWCSLQPWRSGGPAGDTEAKWARWVTGPGILILDGIEVDAFLDTGIS